MGPGKEEDEEGRGGGEERGGIGKISKQISDWARHNSDFHVCLPSDPSGLVSFGVMFKLLNYAREDSRAHVGRRMEEGRAGLFDGIFSLSRVFFFPSRARAPVTSRISIFALFTGWRRSTPRRVTNSILTFAIPFPSPLSPPPSPPAPPGNYRFDFLTISASDSVSIGYIIMQRYLFRFPERENRFYVKRHLVFFFLTFT